MATRLKETESHFKKVALIVVGIMLDALGVAAFVLPHQFLAGGVTGVGRVLNHYFGWNISYIVAVVSFVLLALGWMLVGTKFALSIIAGSILFPVFLSLFTSMPSLSGLTDNVMIAAVFGGGLMGLGLGLIIRAGASSGGSDVIPVILNKKLGLPVGPLIYITDTVILLMQLHFAKVDDILMGILVIFICSAVLSKVVIWGNSNVQFTIVTDKYKEVNELIHEKLDLGSTMLIGETGHYHNETKVIICVVEPNSVSNLKTAIQEVDPESFITMINVTEVRGRGFTMARRY